MVNGHADPTLLGVLLGQIQNEGQRQTEIMLAGIEETRRLREDLRELPTRIASQMPACRARSTAPTGLSPMGWVRIAAGAAILGAALGGRLAPADAASILRALVGL